MHHLLTTTLKLQQSLRSWSSILLLGIGLALSGHPANALPGESVDTVQAWINAHPTLRPGIGDGLRVTKSDTAAQQFTFQATVLPPGRVMAPRDRGRIRSERMSFYDRINGVTFDQLEDAVRVIYGPTIYDDFNRARIVYEYPVRETIDLARRRRLPLLEAQQGQLRLGERFAYWMEVTQTSSGEAYNGQLTVFLKEDLDKMETELRHRRF